MCARAWRRCASVFRSTSLILAVLAVPPAFGQGGPDRTLEGLARVTDDGHLVVQGRRVALFGIDLPVLDRTCRQTRRPVTCGPRSVLILADRVRGFVHCELVGWRMPDLIDGRCTVAGRRLLDGRRDLAAMMLDDGWAFVRPEAPPAYHALERRARHREIGMWRDAAITLH